MPLPDFVRVDCPEFGVEDCLAHPQELRDEFLVVRLELPDNHAAIKDCRADGFTDDEMEFISYIHLAAVRTMDGTPFLRSREFNQEKDRQQRIRNERRVQAAVERVKNNRLKLPELDLALRNRHMFD